jgi:hypothetical protein
MSTNIRLKRSAVEGKIPRVSDLQLGEIALNTFDGKLFIKKDNGVESIVEIGGGGGSTDGSVVNNFVRTDSFVGDGNTVQYTLSSTPYDDSHSFVYINGVAQDITTYQILNDTIILDQALDANSSLEVRTFQSVFSGEKINSTANTLSDAANTYIVDSFSISAVRTAKYIIQMNDGVDIHSTEVLLMHNDTQVFMTEYGTLKSNNALGVIDSEIVDGNVNLTVTPLSANTGVKTLRLSVGT